MIVVTCCLQSFFLFFANRYMIDKEKSNANISQYGNFFIFFDIRYMFSSLQISFLHYEKNTLFGLSVCFLMLASVLFCQSRLVVS